MTADNDSRDEHTDTGLRVPFVDEAFETLGRDAELRIFLEMCRAQHSEQPALSALQGLEYIAARWNLPGEDSEQPESVEVPLWIIETLGFALSEYRDALNDPPPRRPLSSELARP